MDIFTLERGTAPLLISLPHDGTEVPAELAAPVGDALSEITLGALAERIVAGLGGGDGGCEPADAGDLDLALERRPDRLGLLEPAAALAAAPEDHSDRPRAELDRLLGVLDPRDPADLGAGPLALRHRRG